MATYQPTTYRIRLTDMAVTTGCMARRTMVPKHHFQITMTLRRRPGIDRSPVTALSAVQAVLICMIGIFVASLTNLFLTSIWPDNQTGMRSLLVFCLLAAMAKYAINLTMYISQVIF
jgi:hypothetical protein